MSEYAPRVHPAGSTRYNTHALIDFPCVSEWKPRAQLSAMRLRESMKRAGSSLWKPRFVGGKIVWQRLLLSKKFSDYKSAEVSCLLKEDMVF